jgi:DNA polymerase
MAKDKAAQMKEIVRAIRDLEESPLYDFRKENGYSAVIGEGNVDADIMFIGEAPGEQEAKSGRPFVGAAGQVLDELLQSIGLAREDVYITNIVKDRPPQNRDPTVAEIELYSPLLVRQLQIIQPKVIATLGRFAMDFILEQFDVAEKGQKIGQLHGKVLAAQAPHGKVSVVPLYHPAVTFYSRDRKQTLADDFQVLKQFTK